MKNKVPSYLKLAAKYSSRVWLALDSKTGQVVAKAKDGGEAIEKARKKGVKNITVLKIPKSNVIHI